MSLLNLKLYIHIWSTNINFRPPLQWTFWSVSVWTITLWVNCGGGSIGLATIFFVTDRNVNTWVAPRSVREARLKKSERREIRDRLTAWLGIEWHDNWCLRCRWESHFVNLFCFFGWCAWMKEAQSLPKSVLARGFAARSTRGWISVHQINRLFIYWFRFSLRH